MGENEKAPGGNRGQVLPNYSSQEYAFGAWCAEKMFPAWCADVLALMLELIKAQAVLVRERLRPAGLHPLRCPSGGVLLLRYNLQGRVTVTGGDCDPEVLDLARAVLLVLPYLHSQDVAHG